MRIEKFYYCSDDLSRTYAEVLSLLVQLSFVPEYESMSTILMIGGDFGDLNQQDQVTIGQRLAELLEMVLNNQLTEEQLIQEWEKIKKS